MSKPRFRLTRKTVGTTLVYATSLLVAFVFMAPILWVINLSLKSRTAIFAWPPAIIDFTPTLVNYQSVFRPNGHFVSVIVNSIFVALVATTLAIVVGSCAAFGMSGRRAESSRRGSRALALWMLIFRMMPPVAVVIPYYVIFKSLGIIGTNTAIIASHSAFALAIVVWIIKGFFDEIPKEIEEAAIIDGATPFQIFTRVIIPVSKSVIAASCIFAFLTSWNEFLIVSLISSAATQTLPIAVSSFINEVYTSWGELAAATVAGVVPALLFAFLGQRYLLAGLAPGAVK